MEIEEDEEIEGIVEGTKALYNGLKVLKQVLKQLVERLKHMQSIMN
jgi:hypothetical protein